MSLRSLSPNVAPTLRTERLRLRAHCAEDFEAVCALWEQVEVVRYIGGRPNTREEAWARLLRHAGHWALLHFGSWMVEDRATGAPLGEVGLFEYRRDIDPPLGEVPEIGWIFTPAAHGRGIATEAVGAILAWADVHLNATEIGCLIHPENAASLRVAQKLGFIERDRTTHRETPYCILYRQRPKNKGHGRPDMGRP